MSNTFNKPLKFIRSRSTATRKLLAVITIALATITISLEAFKSSAHAFCIYNDSEISIIIRVPDFSSSVAIDYSLKPHTKECYSEDMPLEEYTVYLYLKPRRGGSEKVEDLKLLCKEQVSDTSWVSIKGTVSKTSCKAGGH